MSGAIAACVTTDRRHECVMFSVVYPLYSEALFSRGFLPV